MKISEIPVLSAVPGTIKSFFEEILSSLDSFQPTEHGH